MEHRLSPLHPLWEGWKRFGRRIGDLQARMFLTLFYFLLITPFALIVRFASDPLALKPGTSKGWRARIPGFGTPLERARRQF
jgi:hypothetical protein